MCFELFPMKALDLSQHWSDRSIRLRITDLTRPRPRKCIEENTTNLQFSIRERGRGRSQQKQPHAHTKIFNGHHSSTPTLRQEDQVFNIRIKNRTIYQ
jgi:hypothetical protein